MPSPLLDELARQQVLICPACRASKWRIHPTNLECRRCRAAWPIRNGVPDFFNRYQGTVPAADDAMLGEYQALVTTIAKALELPGDEATFRRVSEIVHRASTWTCDSDCLTAEINDLLDRFAPEARSISPPPPASDANRDPHIAFERHYVPRTLPPGARLSANVRVANTGEHPWSSRARGNLVLSGQWIDRRRLPVDPHIGSVRFPVDISPDRSISVPLQIEAPLQGGTYRLRLGLELQETGEHTGETLEIPVRITRLSTVLFSRFGAGPLLGRFHGFEQHAEIPDYGADHAAGVRLIEDRLKSASKNGARILEVGSGTHPHLAWLTEYRLVALDISSPLLELGSLYFGDRFSTRLGFLCADAFDAPLARRSMDAIAMFSALHHFAQPELVLKRLARLLKPRGFLAVMCEPVGDTLEQPETVRDLLKGINEQVFSVDEYRRIFRLAGLREELIRVDGASLKAVLVRR